MMIRSPTSIIEPQPCAVLGTLYSSVTSKVATVTGVYDLLQVSPSASSNALDNKKAYPFFSRTHPSDGGAAKLLPKFMNEVLNVQKLAVVYIADDEYGLSYLNVIMDYAKANGLDVLPVPLTFYTEPSKEDLKEELRALLDSKLGYVVGVFFNNNYDPIMQAAGELGVVG
jgi:ABC-type branched-subunit amino acid transport system substrate-binding protein